MLLKPTAKANPRMENRGEDKTAISPALIGMSLRQDIPGGLPAEPASASPARIILERKTLAANKNAAKCKLSPVLVSQNLTRHMIAPNSETIHCSRCSQCSGLHSHFP